MTDQSGEKSADCNRAQKSNTAHGIQRGRAVLYLQVSTGRQAEQELSIPDQRRQMTDWCNRQGLTIAAEFVEAGASATGDRRPEFQRMVEYVCDRGNQIDSVIVHSFSRFMRDSFAFEFYVRRLAKSGVRVLSITQDVSEDDPAQLMMRKVIALFDEYQSKENAKHVLRAMKENARQG
ncbi:MAG: recombinase family protein, partial [Hyphomicrobium sp.]